MASGAYVGAEYSAGAQHDPVPGRITIRIAVCGESAGGAGVRLSSGGDVRDGAEPRDFRRNAGGGKWTGNANGRQAAFWRKLRERKYTAAFIDQGYCFNAGEWTFPDYPLRGVYARNEVYESVRGWESFEPWLSRIEKMEEDVVWTLAGEIPPEWYGGEWDELEKLVRTLIARRGMVRGLIEAFRVSPRRPFPEWVEH